VTGASTGGPVTRPFGRTSKYTVLTFLPKNLYEQLGKAANFYYFVLSMCAARRPPATRAA
jgi:hypothetical protein